MSTLRTTTSLAAGDMLYPVLRGVSERISDACLYYLSMQCTATGHLLGAYRDKFWQGACRSIAYAI